MLELNQWWKHDADWRKSHRWRVYVPKWNKTALSVKQFKNCLFSNTFTWTFGLGIEVLTQVFYWYGSLTSSATSLVKVPNMPMTRPV